MEWMTDLSIWSSLITLTVLELVLGIDNIVFLTLLVSKVPMRHRNLARRFGLLAAMFTRILLLLSVSWLAKLTQPFFAVVNHPVSGRDLVLLTGGLFLIYKAVTEIHGCLEGGEEIRTPAQLATNLYVVIAQIAVIDIIFSLDSVITAVGLADHLWVMIAAIVLAIGVMMLAAAPIGNFVDEHPTIKMLALSFLVLVGVALMAEGTGHTVPKGYLYFAMAFSFIVEMLNLRLQRKVKPVQLHLPYQLTEEKEGE